MLPTASPTHVPIKPSESLHNIQMDQTLLAQQQTSLCWSSKGSSAVENDEAAS